MKRIRGIISALILSAVVFSVSAQREQNALRSVEERNAYGDNWFISLGGSANLLFAEQDKEISPLKRIKYGGAISVGKWFTPDFGARIQGNYGSLRGFNFTEFISPGYYLPSHDYHYPPMGGDPLDPQNRSKYKFVNAKNGKEGFWQDFDYATATFDLMANFTNLFRGHYNEHNLIDVIPFVGVGWVHAFNNKVTTPNYNHVVARLGVRVNVNITDNIAVYIEPQANATEQEFDGYSGTAIGDSFFNLGLGIQYTFNKRFTTFHQIVRLTADEIDRLNKKINDNRYLIENHQDILERQQNLLDKLEKCCEENKSKEVVTQIIETNCLPDYVRFGLDSYKIETSELRKLAEIADYLKKNASSKLLIVGYADKKTGNPRYNLSLSQKRVEAVAAELKRLGLNENRLIVEWKGDKEQPFPQNEWNRVVVMVERE